MDIQQNGDGEKSLTLYIKWRKRTHLHCDTSDEYTSVKGYIVWGGVFISHQHTAALTVLYTESSQNATGAVH